MNLKDWDFLLDRYNEKLEEIGQLEYHLEQAREEIASLRGHRKTNKKRMKPKHRQRLGHLKLIAVNGVPVPTKGGTQ
ncbi:MAG: hypothetical protein IH886_02570 [Nitrospinae bacterium]|nr:hypothetical protein [Nitrospinota bacterium]